MLKPFIVAALLSVVLVPAVTSAGDGPRIREKAAKKACASGDSQKGVEILADLYVETDDVTYIYNQGRCYEQNHQWVNAIDRFREYLRKTPKAIAADHAEVEKHIADCEAFRAQEMEEARRSVAAPLVQASQPIASPLPASQLATPVNVAEPPSPPDNARGSGLRTTGIVLASVGVAAAAAGLALNLKANSLANDFNRSQSPSSRSSQSSYKTGAIICYGAGAGALVTGIVLYLMGHRAGHESSTKMALLPVLEPTGLSLSAGGTF